MSRRITIPKGSWRALKAHFSGYFGEFFALMYLLKLEVPRGAAWGLRTSLSVHSPLFKQFKPKESRWPLALGIAARAMIPLEPPTGLPHEFRELWSRLAAAWVPKRGEEEVVVEWLRVLASKRLFPLRLRFPLNKISTKGLLEVIQEAERKAEFCGSVVVLTPGSDFAALGLVDCAVSCGDFALIKLALQHKVEKKLIISMNVHDASPRLKAKWVIEVMPKNVVYMVESKLKHALSAVRKEIYTKGNRIYIRKDIGKEELRAFVEQIQQEVQSEFDRRLPKAEIFEGTLEGVEVLEVKTGMGRHSGAQREALKMLRNEALRAQEALSRSIEVTYRVLRIDLCSLEIPRTADIHVEDSLSIL